MSVARVVFFGTPQFAVPSLLALVRAGHDVSLVITQPDRPVGRKRVLTSPAVKQTALELGLRILQPERVRAEEVLQQVAACAPDVLVTAAYGQILPERLLALARMGCLNVHASLLPRWRGAAPLQRAMMAGDTKTGVTLMEMVKELDAGPIVAVRETAIGENETWGALEARIAQLGAELLVEVLPRYLAGAIQPMAQPSEGVTYAERIVRRDEWIDWNQPAWSVHNRIRALSPAPGATCTWNGRPFKVLETRWPIESCMTGDGEPGDVRVVAGTVSVRCADGWLTLLCVQPAGKRTMAAVDWVRGAGAKVHLTAGGQP
ncbi:methionyl-tRNA formyltransferase [Alicyclobacillus herbarius]|uniref:methionyl-tRNA formyltransferase n=1 Tax=Alicyclobacillus herbarius TaxID=122960 RepID=UPI0005556331